MSIQIGDLDIANEIIDLRYQLLRTQLILESVLSRNRETIAGIPLEEIKLIDEKVIDVMKKRYPNMGIQKK